MAATPCTARDARRILEVAADLADTTPDALAAAMVAGTRGTPVPVHIERALHRAMDAGRSPAPSVGRGSVLTPARARTEEVLTRLRGCQARLAAAPEDPVALRAMDDAGYTLCVLMGRATVHEAVLAAEARLFSSTP
ncbi:DUF5133 domain-containing protein [Streptomyces sp. NBC_01296]|uniref:DUF5133 domain-containing protein n=1 Tax=Streptomyces sp. NBC_01296 TaxID=2903816 RepID=UPI002E101747|nr:DUF5133 domain-containing protein [Streptomyces sp. NBC_01296]